MNLQARYDLEMEKDKLKGRIEVDNKYCWWYKKQNGY